MPQLTPTAKLVDLPDLFTETAASDLIDLRAYSAAIGAETEAFEKAPMSATAIRLARRIIHAIFDHVALDVGIVLSCSWGKDSSAMAGLVAEVMLKRRERGLPLRTVLLVVAHTGNEFAEMELRITEQNARLEEWAVRNGFNLKTRVIGPKPKDSLIALLAGAGYALPSYSTSASATSASWCVNRLKIEPIAKAIEMAKEQFPRFVNLLGVRRDESSKREASIDRYSEGLPLGLSRLSSRNGSGEVDTTRLAVQPIAHWSHEVLRTYLRDTMAPWDPWSYESLKTFYRKGASDEDLESASECSIVRTPEGGISNVCTQLGKARFGCTFCVRSRNLSLSNIASRDSRYKWLKAVHGLIYNGIREHKSRLRDMAAHGFDGSSMFVKGYTFKWRYTLLMFLFRAEIESGFTLIPPEVEDAIRAHWERSGVMTVIPADARADAQLWRETGKLRRSYEADGGNYEDLAKSLSDGLPVGVYAYLRNAPHFGKRAALAIPNLMVFAGRGSSFYPHLKTYVFEDHSARGGLLTMVTDTPSDMGKKLNTDAVSGYEGFALELIDVREPTFWERRMMRGRTLFYRHATGELERRIESMTGKPFTPGWVPAEGPAAALHHLLVTNLEFGRPCGEREFADALDEGHFIRSRRGTLTVDQLARLFFKVDDAAGLSDLLTERHEAFLSAFRREHRGLLTNLRSTDKAGDDSARKVVADAVKRIFDIERTIPLFERFLGVVRDLNRLVRQRQACTELINRMAYISRTARYDSQYAVTLMSDLAECLGVPVAEVLGAIDARLAGS